MTGLGKKWTNKNPGKPGLAWWTYNLCDRGWASLGALTKTMF